MIVIGILNSKGGVGKTTLCACLAIRAAEDGSACVVDIDPQESISEWHMRRKSPDNPALYSGEDRATAAIEKLMLTEGHNWVLLDGAPGSLTLTRDAIEACDLVVIPVRASMLDIDATRETVGLCLEAERAYVLVLNSVSSLELLKTYGLPVAQQQIAQRVGYVNAMTTGKAAQEKDRAAAEEIEALWAEVKAMAIAAAKARKVQQ
jgi:chromosome partitioning protein